MRVIAGSARGRRLSEFKGQDVRPTPDRVREALFSILQSRIGSFNKLTVLDLFAGSGAVAIEALSRGAESALLVERSSAVAEVTRDNVERCRFNEQAQIMVRDALATLSELSAAFDLIFLDPPYRKNLALQAAEEIEARGLLTPGGILCIETASNETLPEKIGILDCFDQRRYGSVMIHFYCMDAEG